MSTKPFVKGYHLARAYRSVIIYVFAPNGARTSTSAEVPDPGLTRRQRYNVLAARLREEGFNPPPSYRP